MRNVVVFGGRAEDLKAGTGPIEVVETGIIGGIPLACGVVHTPDPQFDRKASENRLRVLVKIKAFSCNYRDQALMLMAASKGVERSFYVVGSEFVGEVVDMGPEVTGFDTGDRVIGDNSYTGSGVNAQGGLEGVPTNHASKEYQVFHQSKLIPIPNEMPDEVAAAFSIGAQTVYSMIRKLNVTDRSNVLVTAARSNTSLFAINALKQSTENIYATTTSMQFERSLKELGVRGLFQFDRAVESLAQLTGLGEVSTSLGGFDCVFDPFFDLHLEKALDVMAPGGRYITCGLYDQYQSLLGQELEDTALDFKRMLTLVFVKNLQIIGNCIGLTADLSKALEDYAAGSFKVIIDSVFSGHQVGDFFKQTYSAPDRFGKVVYRYTE